MDKRDQILNAISDLRDKFYKQALDKIRSVLKFLTDLQNKFRSSLNLEVKKKMA